jgi:PAS domain S-box-containing protein
MSPFTAVTQMVGDPQALLLALTESCSDAIICTDAEGTILTWNRGAQAIFGFSADEMIGRPARCLIPPDQRAPERERVLALVAAGERIPPYVSKRARKDGSLIDVESTITPIRSPDGLLRAFAAIGRDVTDRMRREAELLRSNQELEQFAYAASHDLSEPLRVIAGFVELLAQRYQDRLDDEAKRFIEFTISGVERMQAVIDDLLAYSRAGRVELALCEVDTGALIREVADALFAVISERGALLETTELPIIRAEPTLLRQVFQNLIGNAIKFCDRQTPKVQVSARREGEAWRFDVIDNGPGIDPRHAEQVFTMFRRLHGRDVPGTGIGLAIVKRIVERHGGRVWCRPAAEQGSCFSFTIPDRLAPAHSAQSARSDPAAEAPPALAPSAGGAERER